MFDHSFPRAILLLPGIATTAAAHADGPKAGFKFNAEETIASPDQSLPVEQYSKELKDQAVLYQFWTFDRDHQQANLLKGMEENYAWLGLDWPDSRYVMIGLSFDIPGAERPTPWIEGWWYVYDLKTTEFSVPSAFAVNNAKAPRTPGFDQD
jgi:hypothetical protein